MCTSTLGIVCPQTCCMKFNLRQGIFIIVAIRSVIYLITLIVTLKPFYQSVEEPLTLPTSDENSKTSIFITEGNKRALYHRNEQTILQNCISYDTRWRDDMPRSRRIRVDFPQSFKSWPNPPSLSTIFRLEVLMPQICLCAQRIIDNE